MLSRLRAPSESDLCHKRKILIRPPVGKKRSSHSGYKKSKDPNVTPLQRVKEFPNEHLCVSVRNLFCNVCREKLCVKQSTVKNHLTSINHADSKTMYKKGELRDGDIVKALPKDNPVGQTLPQEQRLYRIKVVMTLLKAGVSLNKLDAMLSDNRNLGLLPMELATVVDVGEYFVSGTYKMEGDGLLAITCFEEIVRVRTSLTVGHYPNMVAISNRLAVGNPIVAQQWMKYGMDYVRPGIDYFHSKFGNDSSPPLNAFKAARLASLLKVNDLKPVASDIDTLKCIPVLNKSETIENLLKELPTYLAKTNGISTDINALDWCR